MNAELALDGYGTPEAGLTAQLRDAAHAADQEGRVTWLAEGGRRIAAIVPAELAQAPVAGKGATYTPVAGLTHRHGEGSSREHNHMAGGVPHQHDPDTGFQVPAAHDAGLHCPGCTMTGCSGLDEPPRPSSAGSRRPGCPAARQHPGDLAAG